MASTGSRSGSDSDSDSDSDSNPFAGLAAAGADADSDDETMALPTDAGFSSAEYDIAVKVSSASVWTRMHNYVCAVPLSGRVRAS